MNKSVFILANRSSGASYVPEEIIEDKDEFFASLEYGDVHENEFQLWQYPEGKIYKIHADRALPNEKYYSTPYSHDGTVWLPTLVLETTDKLKVSKAYDELKRD